MSEEKIRLADKQVAQLERDHEQALYTIAQLRAEIAALTRRAEEDRQWVAALHGVVLARVVRRAEAAERALAESVKLAERLASVEFIDWGQVLANGGPPCFHLDSDTQFCLRAERWQGHGIWHPFTPLQQIFKEWHASRKAASEEGKG